ncbi:thiol-disulfide oxidoreductase DCC family protein [Halobacterium rubrum]|uniref:thiol-disulfide oxidoreductase DCC family protein n=1 Tax=Halobacterium TaxID=2239 RepID=UPI001F3723CE|nr:MULTISPECIES: DCC1-like thiol-disulfide oxidoreductase family protein [Halobacterium]MDH5018648.1 DCC1-like thiol-disulfide oxidoreductase family protein [Halobacterium rubrum]
MPEPDHPPRLVFDDDCGFCTWCANFAARHGDVELVGFTELSPDQVARLPDDYEDCAHLLTDDAVYSCGAAIERTLEHDFPELRPVFAALGAVPGYAVVRERLYRWGADNRVTLGKLARDDPPARE